MKNPLSPSTNMRQFSLVTLVLALLLMLGCASVKNYDASNKSIGFEHYAGKHYLLVETGKDGQVLKIITLPDLSKPRYVKYKAGWGSVEFDFVLQNGVLTEFGATHDSNTGEVLATLGTLGTAYGALLGAEAAAVAALGVAEITAAAGSGAVGSPPTITIKTLMDVASRLQTNVVNPLASDTDVLLMDVKSKVTAEISKLQVAAKLDPNKEIVGEIQKAQQATRSIAGRLTAEGDKLELFLEGLTVPALRAKVISVMTALRKEIGILRGFAPSTTRQPLLYEIKERSSGGIEFVPVTLG